MYQTFTVKQKIRLFVIILFPIFMTQISMTLMNFFDTVMSGQSGAVDLAGVAIGSSLWVPVFTGVNGILLAITPMISHLVGANIKNQIPKTLQQGVYVSIFLAMVVILIGWLLLDPVLMMMDLDGEVRHVAKYYLVSLGTGIIPLFIFNTLRSFIDALGQTRLSMTILLLALPVNIVLNYIFIFGKLGLPAFGGIGAGIATSLTYYFICFVASLILSKAKAFQDYQVLKNWSKPNTALWKEQLLLGIPIGLAIFFETSIFSAVTLLMSAYDTITIAAHQAALNFANVLYMIPLSVGMALTIVVGFEVGAKRLKHARQYTYIGIGSGVFIAGFAGLILFLFNETVANMYSSDPAVASMIVQFIYFAIVYQFADAFGAPIQGALRGYKDVNTTLIIALLSYWGIGLPTGSVLANATSLEPFGYWVGIIAGLSTGALALFTRLLFIQKKFLHNQMDP